MPVPPVVLKPLSATEATLVSSVSLLQEKLDRVRTYIIDKHLDNGRLAPEYQLAVRIVESRKRELLRHLLLRIRPIGDPERMQAEAELKMARLDNGDIFRWGLKSHAYGRLGCPGCEYDYKQTRGMLLPVKVVTAKVCSRCSRGVMHSQLAESPQEVREAILAFWRATGIGSLVGSDVGAKASDVGAMVMVCESCGYAEVDVCS